MRLVGRTGKGDDLMHLGGQTERKQGGGARLLRRFACATAMSGSMLFSTLAMAAPESPAGHTWKTIDDETNKAKSYVQIVEVNHRLYGTIVKLLENPRATCDKCEGDKKDKPIQGMVILWGLKKSGDEWSGGKILDPKKGKIYRAKMWIENGELQVRGYIGPFFRTQTWKLVE